MTSYTCCVHTNLEVYSLNLSCLHFQINICLLLVCLSLDYSLFSADALTWQCHFSVFILIW